MRLSDGYSIAYISFGHSFLLSSGVLRFLNEKSRMYKLITKSAVEVTLYCSHNGNRVYITLKYLFKPF